MVGTVSVAGGGAARRARVTLAGDALRGGRSVTTDDQGRYAFNDLPEGRFTLSASKTGYLTVSYGQRVAGSGRPGTPIVLQADQRLSIALQLPRGGVISGTVLDEQGEAVPGTLVRAFRFSFQSGSRRLQPAGSDATDDRGIYRIYGLQLGDYLVGASPRTSTSPGAPGLERLQAAVASGRVGAPAVRAAATLFAGMDDGAGTPAPDEGANGYAPVYYPGTPVSTSATAITLNVGEERLGVDFQLQLVPMARVEGIVVFPGGQEPAGLQVRLVNVGDEIEGIGDTSARVEGDGHFRFDSVPPGQYSVIARSGGAGPVGPLARGLAAGRAGRAGGPGSLEAPPGRGAGRPASTPRLWAAADLTVEGRDVPDVVLTLQSGFSVSGRLEFRGTTLERPADLTGIRVTLTPAGMAEGGRALAVAAAGRVDEHGAFSVDGVIPGRYRLASAGPGGWILESAVIGGQDALEVPIELRSSQNLTGAVITFTDQQTMLSGTVTNAQGQALSDYTVVAYPGDERYWVPQSRRIRAVRPATDGSFSIAALPPGEYRLAAVLDPEPGAWFDPAVLRLLTGSEAVTLADGEKKVQHVRVGF
jgi:protocatechuate 3,4-dioxygenase beta subunit